MGEHKSNAVAVLRDIWATNGASESELDSCAAPEGCKSMSAELGIQGMNDPRIAAVQTREWRRQMDADGKAPLNARSIGKEFAEQIKSAGKD